MKTVAIIQARMGSTRLPGKVMLNLYGKSMLQHVVERVYQAQNIDDIIIATTMSEQDNIIVKEAFQNGIRFFRGSEWDVLERYYLAAKENKADTIVRITSDCPLIDPLVIDEIISLYKKEKYDLVTNASSDLSQRTYPRGLDTEVFSFNELTRAFKNADKQYQREHVTPYIYETNERIFYYKNPINYSQYRWTLDTEEDFRLIKEIYLYLYHKKHDFYLEDIVKLMKKYPELAKINAHIEQKKLENE